MKNSTAKLLLGVWFILIVMTWIHIGGLYYLLNGDVAGSLGMFMGYMVAFLIPYGIWTEWYKKSSQDIKDEKRSDKLIKKRIAKENKKTKK